MQEYWVFAYGSNMDLEDLTKWLQKKPEFAGFEIFGWEIATLPGYELVWNYYSKSRNAGAANVHEKKGRSLPGLALKVNEKCLAGIDKKEGHPNYYDRGNKPVSVTLQDGRKVDCWLYVARKERTRSELVPPTQQYLDLLIKAAEKFQFPSWYQEELKQTPIQKT